MTDTSTETDRKKAIKDVVSRVRLETQDLELMYQVAPYPTELAAIISSLAYRAGWSFMLRFSQDREQGSHGLTFNVYARVISSVDNGKIKKDESIYVLHTFIVPAASYNRDSWMRWVLDCLIKVETHEACEFFEVAGERVFAPHHSEGEDPYIIWQIGDRDTASKSSRDK